jgi:hypothetical protein
MPALALNGLTIKRKMSFSVRKHKQKKIIVGRENCFSAQNLAFEAVIGN